jgi:uncharacterized protein YyaL (SSP411 family)
MLSLLAVGALSVVCPTGAVHAQAADPVDSKPRFTNRLIDSKSPYLRLHAHDPVDWFPWGEEAFEKARREGKPLLVSIGYSTCHWCHVMRQESFSDPAIAGIMNESFVSIKVDREERPDIDRVYMSYLQAATGSGGWPMTLFLTPDLKPFFGGTYYAPDNRNGRPGLRTLFRQMQQAWTTQHDQLLLSAEKSTQALSAQVATAVVDSSIVWRSLRPFETPDELRNATFGGFGNAPKFPRPVVFNFLLRYHVRTGDKAALDMTLATLRAMAGGGSRSSGRRISSVYRRSLARPALREDAVRPGAARHLLSRGVSDHERSGLRRRRPRHSRICAARHAGPRGRLLFGAGCRQSD